MLTKRFKLTLLSFLLLAAAGTDGLMAMCVATNNGAVIESKDAQNADNLQKQNELGQSLINVIWSIGNVISEKEWKISPRVKQMLDQDVCNDVRKLLKEGANVNWYNYLNSTDRPETHHEGWTPLAYAARYGLISCLDTLICAGANINFYSGLALQLAIQYGHLDCAQHLVAVGATINRSYLLDVKNCYNRKAVYTTQLAIIEYLVAIGISPDHIHLYYVINGQYHDIKTLSELSDETIKTAIQNGIKKRQVRLNWMRITPLLAFCRANRKHPFKNSILPLINHDIMPFITANPSQTKKNDTNANTSSASNANPT